MSVFLQICAVVHLLKRLTATKIYTLPRVFDLIGPAKSNWISWFGSNKIPSLFLSVDGNCVFKFLPDALPLGQLSDFSRISRCRPGHQNASADWSEIFLPENEWMGHKNDKKGLRPFKLDALTALKELQEKKELKSFKIRFQYLSKYEDRLSASID